MNLLWNGWIGDSGDLEWIHLITLTIHHQSTQNSFASKTLQTEICISKTLLKRRLNSSLFRCWEFSTERSITPTWTLSIHHYLLVLIPPPALFIPFKTGTIPLYGRERWKILQKDIQIHTTTNLTEWNSLQFVTMRDLQLFQCFKTPHPLTQWNSAQ